MIGEVLGNYRLTAELGSGSMGVVYLAEHQRIARQVAIKLLAPELVRDPQAVQRFFTEARATSLIRHSGIVDVFDCDVDASGRAFMVMEHLAGQTLAERLRRAEQLPWVSACAIARQVADALGAAHDRGIVHRDLKPENVFLVADSNRPTADDVTVKVLDFGVAKLLAVDPSARLTSRGMLVGTPEYMSPEQCDGSEAVDHRADIYALGCILFEMVTGKPPFAATTVQEFVTAHRFIAAPALAAAAPDVPAWLGALLARMLSKQPDQRPASMHEVSKALRGQEAPAPVASPAAATSTMTGRAAIVEGTPKREPPRAVAAAPVGRLLAFVNALQGRRGWIAFAFASVLVVAGAVWAARRSPGSEPALPPGPPTVVTNETRAGTAPAAEPASVARAPVAPAPVVPTAIAPEAVVDARPEERRPDADVRPARRARPNVRQPPDVVDTDGIVDL